jgi:hypothetical protein
MQLSDWIYRVCVRGILIEDSPAEITTITPVTPVMDIRRVRGKRDYLRPVYIIY